MKKQIKEAAGSDGQKFRTIVEQTADAIFITDVEGIIEYVNPAFEKLTGYNRRDVIGKTPQIIKSGMHSEKFYHTLWSTIKSGKIFRDIIVNRKKNGELFYADHTITPVKNRNGKIIYFSGIWKDITQNKQVEENSEYLLKAGKILASSLDYKTTLARIAQIAVPYVADWCSVDLLDEKGVLQNVAVMHKNPAMIRWAKRLIKIVPPYMEAPQGLPNVIRTGKPELYPYITDKMLISSARNKMELQILKRVGFYSVMIAPIFARKKAIGGITFVTTKDRKKSYGKIDLNMAEEIASRASMAIDNAMLYQKAKEEIIARLKAEKNVKRSQKQLQDIINGSSAHIFVKDLEGKYLMINHQRAKFLHLKIKDIIGRKDNNLFPKEIAKKLIENDQKVLKEQKELIFEEQLINQKIRNPIIHTFLSVKFPLHDLNNKFYAICGIATNITERKEIEKMKEDFLGIVSHELKTPVTSLKIYTQALAKQFEGSEHRTIIRFFEKMDLQIDRLTRIIRELLDLSRIDVGKLEIKKQKFNIEGMASDIIENFQATTRKHKLILKSNGNSEIFADEDRIRQVLINLINNAIKYSPDGGKIITTIRPINEKINVSVKDDGIGINKEDQRKIFDRFYQVSDSIGANYTGLGMGLYISNEIIKQHGDKINVRSEKGKGATFSFKLPAK
ncbi:MAG: PAS domain S-box protein [Candidatus Levybacteria bacterium]|nr:PAS domain S-box protein [Candidatus Levybacteria bacterium]